VGEASPSGGSISEVARRYGIDPRLLFRWRREFGIEPTTEPASFLPVQIADEGGPAIESGEASGQSAAPSIIVERVATGNEIELIGGRLVRFDREVDPETMKRVVAALEGGGPRQITEAFPWNDVPRYLIRDRDAAYGHVFRGLASFFTTFVAHRSC
jgi:hypothetical protein